MRKLLLVLITVITTAAAARAQSPEARELFYQRAAKPRADSWTGVRTSIVLEREGTDGVCRIREVGDNAVFQDGDKFRLRVQSNADAYLYLLLDDEATGEARLLFPYEDKGKKVNRIRRF